MKKTTTPVTNSLFLVLRNTFATLLGASFALAVLLTVQLTRDIIVLVMIMPVVLILDAWILTEASLC